MRRMVAWLGTAALVVSLAGVAGARPATTYTGVWDGDTDQNKLVTFRVDAQGNLTRFRIKYDIHGDNCVLHTTALWTGSTLIENDAFRVHVEDLDGVATFEGEFVHRNVATGTYKSSSDILSGCAGRVDGTWKASS